MREVAFRQSMRINVIQYIAYTCCRDLRVRTAAQQPLQQLDASDRWRRAMVGMPRKPCMDFKAGSQHIRSATDRERLSDIAWTRACAESRRGDMMRG
eukprot:3616351-Amphidinium_carterae.5